MESIRPVQPVSILKSEGIFKAEKEQPVLTDGSFEKVLAKALNGVNDLQLQSADLDAKMASGQLEYVHQAMVMAEKANMALQFTMQVRNKVVEAYQEIMRTQL